MTQESPEKGEINKFPENPLTFSDDDVLFGLACCWDYLTMSSRAVIGEAKDAALKFNHKVCHLLVIQHKMSIHAPASTETMEKAQVCAELVDRALELSDKALERDDYRQAMVHIEEARTFLEHTLGATPPNLDKRE